MRVEDTINRAWSKGINAEAEDVIRLGWAAGAKLARRQGWMHEIEDIKQDAALGALLAWRGRPEASVPYVWASARSYAYYKTRGRRFRGDGRIGVGLRDVDDMERCVAAIDIGRLIERAGVTPREERALVEEGEGRGDDAHYQARSRAMRRLRCFAQSVE